jgi:hypothetical protein
LSKRATLSGRWQPRGQLEPVRPKLTLVVLFERIAAVMELERV